MRSSIVYATMIILLAADPDLPAVESSPARSSAPLVLSYGLAVARVAARRADDHAGAEPAPALAGRRSSVATRRSCAWLKRGYAWLLCARDPPAAARVPRRPPDSAGRACASCRPSASRWCPTFKERDFLGHFITKPGTSLTEETRIDHARPARPRRRFRVSHTSGTHIGQAFLADEIAGVELRRELDRGRSARQLRARPSRRSRQVVDSYPGVFHDVQTYLNERIDEVLAGPSEPIVVRIFGNDLRRSASEADDVRAAISRRQGRERPVRRVPGGRCRRRRSRSSSPPASATA